MSTTVQPQTRHYSLSNYDKLKNMKSRLQKQTKSRKKLMDTALKNSDSTTVDILLLYTGFTPQSPHFKPVFTPSFRKRKAIRDLKQNLHQQSSFTNFCLFIAARDGDKEMCKLLIRYHANVNADFELQTPLFAASKCGHRDCIRLLLKNGANVNQGDMNDGISPFMAAVMACPRETLIPLDNATTLIISLLMKNYFSCLKSLHTFNADINQTDYRGFTALMYAVKKYSLSQYLIQLGCSLEVQSDNGIGSALYIACLSGEPTIKLLLDSGADVDAFNLDDRSCTSLCSACHYHNSLSVELLLEAGADLDVPSNIVDLSILQVAESQFDRFGDKAHDVWKKVVVASRERLYPNVKEWVRLARAGRNLVQEAHPVIKILCTKQ